MPNHAFAKQIRQTAQGKYHTILQSVIERVKDAADQGCYSLAVRGAESRAMRDTLLIQGDRLVKDLEDYGFSVETRTNHAGAIQAVGISWADAE